MNKLTRLTLCIGITILALTTNAHASFSVNWQKSYDDHLYGYQQLGKWLVTNNYYTNQAVAENFAKTGYIGYESGEADPFYWAGGQKATVQIVAETTEFKNQTVLGYYYSGNPSGTTQLLSGTQNGPTSLSATNPFGFYITTPGNTWYTDRFDNSNKSAQALVYSLGTDKWLIAFEDSNSTVSSTDNDYNDMYVLVDTNNVVPEPMSLLLLGSGLAGFLGLRRKV
ncbi:MAG: PEP-CTERM sorting domain-containing protein [Candidatus Omnitrophica bacterium]|nr:PEP-CTERM sorting domain-containing protein [Candidatus Omnitrophota bacterium]